MHPEPDAGVLEGPLYLDRCSGAWAAAGAGSMSCAGHWATGDFPVGGKRRIVEYKPIVNFQGKLHCMDALPNIASPWKRWAPSFASSILSLSIVFFFVSRFQHAGCAKLIL